MSPVLASRDQPYRARAEEIETRSRRANDGDGREIRQAVKTMSAD